MRYLMICTFAIVSVQLPAQKVFSSLEEVLYYTRARSITSQSNDIKFLQAKKARLTALVGMPDPVIGVNMNLTNNLNLPVSVFPSEVLGGEPGTFQEVQTGVRYNTFANGTFDIKLLNIPGIMNVRLSKINLMMTEVDNKITLKNLYQSIASAYFNIVQLQAQLVATKQNALAADTILRIAENKYSLGLVKVQDVNDSKINLLNMEEAVRQIQYLIEQGYLSFKVLCDIPDGENVIISDSELVVPKSDEINIDFNTLQIESSLLRENYAWLDYKRNTSNIYPTLSFVFSNSYNQYNQDFTIAGGRWIHSNYIGLKLNFTTPNASTLANRFKARYDYQLAIKNADQMQLRTTLEQQQMKVDYEKAFSQYTNDQEVLILRRDTYARNKRLYSEGIMGMEQTLTSFTNMLNSEYSMIASMANTNIQLAKIYINNIMNQ